MCGLICLAALLTIGGGAWARDSRAGARQSSPPAVVRCDVPPRTPEFLLALAETASPPAASPASSSTPAMAASASLLPEEATEGITLTMEQITACLNEGDFARFTALFTDAYWQRGSNDVEAAQVLADVVSTPPAPLPVEKRVDLVAIRDMRSLADGRVAAVVVLNDGHDAEPDLDLVVFERVGEVWLIDEVIADYDASATPAA